MTSFVQYCQANSSYKKFNSQLESGKYNVNLVDYYKKVEGLHATRIVRRLTVKQIAADYQKYLMEATLQNQQYRSDSVDYKKECFKVNSLLTWHTEELKGYLINKYPKSFKELGNENNRQAAWNVLFANAYSITSQNECFIEYVDMVIEDIDKAGWTLKNLTDVLNLNISRLPEL